MTAMIRTTPESGDGGCALAPELLLHVFTSQSSRFVYVTGELDLATRDELVSASTTGHHPDMVIDLGGVTFMDCSGYGALIDSQRIIESQGRSLTITGQTGQPARLFDLIAELEEYPLQPALTIRRSVA